MQRDNPPPNNGTLQPRSGSCAGTTGPQSEDDHSLPRPVPSSVPHRATPPQFLAPWTRPPPGLGSYVAHSLRASANGPPFFRFQHLSAKRAFSAFSARHFGQMQPSRHVPLVNQNGGSQGLPE